jgi:hypothetical protein
MPDTTAPPPRTDGSRAVPSPELREIITRDAFRLAPELLGTPLARPWRRGVAMALDGIFIAILSGVSGVLFGFAAALVLFRISGRPAPGGYVRKSIRLVVRFWAAMILFVMVLVTWGSVTSLFDGRRETNAPAETPEASGEAAVTGTAGVRIATDLPLLPLSSTEAAARARAERVVPALRATGVSDAEIREIFAPFREDQSRPWLVAVADSVVQSLGGEPASRAADSDTTSFHAVVLAYAAALEQGDTAAARELLPAAAAAISADTISRLREEIEAGERARVAEGERARSLQDELDQGPGIMGMLRGLADDLGLGLGWAGLYFTTFVTLWKGRTPGKRIMGIRVIRLDGQQIGWWAAFERFGGYAAGVATGLLGFAQIFWDRNRQAVQDKVSETVVIRDARHAG